MIMSRSRNFVFVKGRKVAGTSVEMALSTLCGPADIVTPITPRDERARLEMGGRPVNFAKDPAKEAFYIAAVRTANITALSGIRHPQGYFTNHMGLEAVIAKAPEAAAMPVVFVERKPMLPVASLGGCQRQPEGRIGSRQRSPRQSEAMDASTGPRQRSSFCSLQAAPLAVTPSDG